MYIIFMEPTTGYLVWRLSMRWRAAVDRAVKPLGLTHATFSLLGVLTGLSRGGKRPSQRELADHTGLDAIYVSKLARTLEKAGLLDRPADPDDPRAVRLGLTDRGHEVITAAFDVMRELNEELTSAIGGTKGTRNRRLRTTLLALLGEENAGGETMTTTERTISGRDINLAAAAAKSLMTVLLDREELTFGQYIVLRTAVLGGETVTAETLLENSAGPAIGTVAELRPAIGLLTGRGLLAGDDVLEATPAGRKLVERITADSTAAGDRLFEGFTAEELDTTKRVLNLVTERASEVRDAL